MSKSPYPELDGGFVLLFWAGFDLSVMLARLLRPVPIEIMHTYCNQHHAPFARRATCAYNFL
jgi:hypothetical protein